MIVRKLYNYPHYITADSPAPTDILPNDKLTDPYVSGADSNEKHTNL